jgi:hypothetical protein
VNSRRTTTLWGPPPVNVVKTIGRLKRFFLNESGGAEYTEVKVGLFGLKTILIPLQTVTADAGWRFLVLE